MIGIYPKYKIHGLVNAASILTLPLRMPAWIITGSNRLQHVRMGRVIYTTGHVNNGNLFEPKKTLVT